MNLSTGESVNLSTVETVIACIISQQVEVTFIHCGICQQEEAVPSAILLSSP